MQYHVLTVARSAASRPLWESFWFKSFGLFTLEFLSNFALDPTYEISMATYKVKEIELNFRQK